MFDLQTFMNTSVEEASSTKYIPIPAREYNAVITKGEAKLAGEAPVLEILWRIDAPDVEEANEKIVRQSVWIDINAAGTGLDMAEGKNVSLGRLREAVGQNVTGQVWSPNMLIGQPAVILVEHRMRKDTGEPVAQVKSVRKL